MKDNTAEVKTCPTCTGNKKIAFEKFCHEHNVCITCGIHRSELKEIPWGTRYGAFLCRGCEIIERKKRIKERKKAGFDHEYTNEIVCPYCGYECGDSWEFSDSGDHECDDCKKTFDYERIVTCEYSTSKPPKRSR